MNSLIFSLSPVFLFMPGGENPAASGAIFSTSGLLFLKRVKTPAF
jgi:hypothetical protein